MAKKQKDNKNMVVKTKNAVAQRTNKMAKTAKSKASNIKPMDVAKGAAIVSAVSGAVAAGAALSDEKTRKKVGSTARKGMKKAQEFASSMTDQVQENYPAIQHRIMKGSKSSKNKTSSKKK